MGLQRRSRIGRERAEEAILGGALSDLVGRSRIGVAWSTGRKFTVHRGGTIPELSDMDEPSI